MKDKTLKPAIKSAKKEARAAIQLRIVSQVKLIAKEFGQDSQDLIHDIEKGAKKLSKKISEKLTITLPDNKVAPKENKLADTAVKPKPAISEKKSTTPVRAANTRAKKVTAKTAAAKPVKKEEAASAKTKLPAKKS